MAERGDNKEAVTNLIATLVNVYARERNIPLESIMEEEEMEIVPEVRRTVVSDQREEAYDEKSIAKELSDKLEIAKIERRNLEGTIRGEDSELEKLDAEIVQVKNKKKWEDKKLQTVITTMVCVFGIMFFRK